MSCATRKAPPKRRPTGEAVSKRAGGTVAGGGVHLQATYAPEIFGGDIVVEWITHESIINKDEAVTAILGHRAIASATPDSDGGISGTYDHPTGVAVVNLHTHEMRIVGQVPAWSKGRSDWHVAGSEDGRSAASDDFQCEVWLTTGTRARSIYLPAHRRPAPPLISKDNRSLNICVVPVPKTFLGRTYSLKTPE